MTVTLMHRAMATLVCAGLAFPGCAARGGGGVVLAPAHVQTGADPHVLAEYAQRLPPGTQVRVGRRTGRVLRGTLVKATDSSIVIQPRTRVPEPPVDIPLAAVVSIVPETPGRTNVGKVVAIAAAAGAGATLGVLLLLAAILSD